MPGISMSRPALAASVLVGGLAWSSGACSSVAGSERLSNRPVAALASPVPGVPDRGDDPAVIAIDVGGQALCAGALIAPDVVLTARGCITPGEMMRQCPAAVLQPTGAAPAQSLRVLVGEDLLSAQERARGRSVVVPPGDSVCSDIALVLLDTPIDEIQPLSVRATGTAQGDHVRTVGFGRLDSAGLVGKVVRDHVHVLETAAAEFVAAESACQRAFGGPAVDELTGAVVGVSSRGNQPGCDAQNAATTYTRTDAFLRLIAAALTQSSGPSRGGIKARTKKGPVDMGATCDRASECAAGVCLTASERQYCSRTCNPHDRCPSRFHCQQSQENLSVCAAP